MLKTDNSSSVDKNSHFMLNSSQSLISHDTVRLTWSHPWSKAMVNNNIGQKNVVLYTFPFLPKMADILLTSFDIKGSDRIQGLLEGLCREVPISCSFRLMLAGKRRGQQSLNQSMMHWGFSRWNLMPFCPVLEAWDVEYSIQDEQGCLDRSNDRYQADGRTNPWEISKRGYIQPLTTMPT